MPDYKSIFDGVESTLLKIGSRKLPLAEIRAYLDRFKHLEGKSFSDEEYYRILVDVVFYSGFRAETVTAKLPVIHGHFPSFEIVAKYGSDEVKAILSDTQMIRHPGKILWCIDNAKIFMAIIHNSGSFQKYIDSFEPRNSEHNLLRLQKELQRLRGLSKITVLHFLTDIGMDVAKPDRVVCRIFSRLGLVERNPKPEDVVRVAREFAKATGHPIRYIDIIFASYGHERHTDVGLDKGVCLEKNPACHFCGITSHCSYYAELPRKRNQKV